MSERSILDDPKGFAAFVAVLVRALGGKVVITQDDLNDIAGTILAEELNPNAGTLTLRVEPRKERPQ